MRVVRNYWSVGRAAALGTLLTWVLGCGAAPQARVFRPAKVAVATPLQRIVTDHLEFTGRLAAVESVELRARVSGHLRRIVFREGAIVKRGDLLLEIDPDPYRVALSQALGNLASTRARLETQTLELDRIRGLHAKGGVSRQALDLQVGGYRETAATLEASKAAADRARLDLDYTRIVAPIDGRIGRALVTTGNLVQSGSTLLTTIVSLDPIHVHFDVDEGSVFRMRNSLGGRRLDRDAAIPVSLEVGSEEGYPHSGTVDFVDNALDSGTATLGHRGVFRNPGQLLLPGMFARVRVPGGPPHAALLVDETAVGTDQRGPAVKVVNANDIVETRPVTVGATLDGLIVVESGVTRSDRVIVRGLQQARPGSKVEPRLVEMSSRAGPQAPEGATR